jgi:hypothetical protein
VRGREEGSVSLPTTASRPLKIAPRLADPLDRKKFELDNIASLDPDKSFVSGAFSLDKIPSLAIGPEVLLRVGSDEDHPVCLTSLPPDCPSAFAEVSGRPELGPAARPIPREGGLAI